MKSFFRIYARTSKNLDPFLYRQLNSFGLTPKHQQLLHAFYFNANFHDLFNLSFNCLTVENLYIQIGNKFPLYSRYVQSGRTAEEEFGEYLKKINFQGYMNMSRGLIENITMNLIIRESTHNLPSENAILGILKNHLQKQAILKQYRHMLNQSNSKMETLENYYDVKMLVQKKWEYQDKVSEKRQAELQQIGAKSQPLALASSLQKQQSRSIAVKEHEEPRHLDIPYQPHLLLYVRKNHGRFLLKINKQNLYKHGWKKHVGWGPIRETIAASVLYRTNYIDRIKKDKEELRLWDPFCGSGTIPLVASAMYSSAHVRQNYMSNFVWPYWRIYKKQYLEQYLEKEQKQRSLLACKVFGSDIDFQSVRYSVENFKQFLGDNKVAPAGNDDFLKLAPVDQVFQLHKNSIYIGHGDFDKLAPKLLGNPAKKITIVTNLPYLNARSKDHHPLNQLTSIYRRFSQMIKKYGSSIENVFVIIDKEGINNPNHFLKVSSEQWRILSDFDNGGIPVMLVGWSKNKDGWGNFEIQDASQSASKELVDFNQQKGKLLQEYRQEIKQIQNKQYKLPKHISDPSKLKGYKRTLQKVRARHLRAAYQIFAKRREGNQIFQRYARKQIALRLSKRSSAWRHKNMSIIGKKLPQLTENIKKQFEERIQEALQRSQKVKELKRKKKAHKKW